MEINMAKPIFSDTIDNYLQSTAIGSLNRAVSNNLFGINHRQTPTGTPTNKDYYGYTFLVRPQLNLSSDNIRNLRTLYSLLTNNSKSVQRFVRTTLDPRLMYGIDEQAPLDCPLVDPLQAFIPVATNNLESLSGWPDIVSPTFTSKSGSHKEQYSQVDGIIDIYEAFQLTLTFNNTITDPIVYLFYVWLTYMSAVFQGTLTPYVDFIKENEIDYNTRIYRIVLGEGKRFVRKIAATGVSFPISVPTGQFFDFNKKEVFNKQTDTFSIKFQSLGAMYQDPILVKEFNATVEIFNPDMKGDKSNMIKLDNSTLRLLNHRGYPHINTETMELEWYINRDTPIVTRSNQSGV